MYKKFVYVLVAFFKYLENSINGISLFFVR